MQSNENTGNVTSTTIAIPTKRPFVNPAQIDSNIDTNLFLRTLVVAGTKKHTHKQSPWNVSIHSWLVFYVDP